MFGRKTEQAQIGDQHEHIHDNVTANPTRDGDLVVTRRCQCGDQQETTDQM